ncbi:MAG: T9SS type A sorting domain-containing protein [Bacteroidota bacterium]
MKKFMLLMMTFFVIATGAKAQLNGNYNIPGAYATLTAAFTAITGSGVSGNVNLILQATYTSAGETFPLVPSTNTGAFTVTIYPAATGLSITSANATGTLNLQACKNYVFDGRVNATGAARDLIIANTTITGYAIKFIDDASSNTIKYCNVKGVATAAASTNGVIWFSTTTGVTGNDNNTIDNCDINASGVCQVGISSTGTASPKENSGNIIQNCSIRDFYSATLANKWGILLNAGNTSWTIQGNSIFQTAARDYGMNGIWIISGNGYEINNNFIGGNAANCAGTWTMTGAFPNTVLGILVAVGNTSVTNIQGNTIKNFAITTTPAASTGTFTGIEVDAGSVNVGTTADNIIGSNTVTGAITINYNASANLRFINGINLFNTSAADVVNVGSASNGNIIGGITLTGTSTNYVLLAGIRYGYTAAGTNIVITNNKIGDGVANSMQNAAGLITGAFGIINQSAGTGIVTISNNIIRNFTNSSTNLNSFINGISVAYNTTTVSNNIISNFSAVTLNVQINNTASIIGIVNTNSTIAGQTITQNTIHSLSSTGAAAVAVYGVLAYFPTTGTNTISNNFIHSFTTSTANSWPEGIGLFAGVGVINNNMIRLGINAAGASVNTNANFRGIDLVTASAVQVYFNTVYIGGDAGAGTYNTYGFIRRTTAVNISNNNIFYNARTGAGAKHYAIAINLITTFTSNYNDLFSSNAANLGSYNAGTTAQTFANWKAGIIAPKDANSINVDPLLILPAGTSATVDLHCQDASPANNLATPIAGITVDIDADGRNATTPDIGADEICSGAPSGTASYAIYAADGSAIVTDCELYATATTAGCVVPFACKVCTPADDSYSNVGISGYTAIYAGDATNNYTNCTGVNMNMTTAAGSPDWTGSDAPLTGTGSPETVAYTTTGRKNVVLAPNGSGTATLLTQGFNSTSIPAGWASVIVTNPAVPNPILTYVASSTFPTISTPAEGADYVHFNSYTCQAGDQIRLYQTTSNFSTVGYTGITVNFYWHQDNIYTNADEVTVQWSANGTTWNNSESYMRYNSGETGQGSWHTINSLLPAGAGGQATLYIAFLFTSGYGNNCDLDGVTVTGTKAFYTYTGFNNMMMAAPSAGTVLGVSGICPATSNYSSSVAGTPGFTYSWSYITTGGSAVIATPTASSTDITFTNNTGSDQTFTIQLIVTSECCGPLTMVTKPVIIYPTPAVPTPIGSATPSMCIGGSQTLAVNVTSGYGYEWYNAPTGGTLLGTGSSYIVSPVLAGANNYYVQAVTSYGCVSPSRLQFTVTGTDTPPIAQDNSACAPGIITVSIGSPVSGATYNWYSASSGGTLLQSSTSTTYDVSVTSGSVTVWASVIEPGCNESSRDAATATVAGSSGDGSTVWTGATSTNWFLCGNWNDGIPSPTTDALIPSGPANQPVINFSQGGVAQVKNITIQNGAGLTFGESQSMLEVYADYTQDGALTMNSMGSIKFFGSVPQSFAKSVTATGNLFTVKINNSSSSVPQLTVTDQNMTFRTDGELILNSGVISTSGSSEVIMQNTATSSISGQSTGSYISGKLTRYVGASGSYDFPVGNTNAYELANINVTSTTGLSYLTTNFSNPSPGTGLSLYESGFDYDAVLNNGGTAPATGNANGGVWTITPDAGTADYDITLSGRNYDNAGTRHTVLKRTTSGPGAWTLAGTYISSSNTSNVVTCERSGLSDFSQFGIGRSSTVLPIELHSFNATCVNEIVTLKWITISETNNDYFTVERSSNSAEWDPLLKVNGAGNSNTLLYYTAEDNEPLDGISYYRLKQTDFDGAFSYSDAVVTSCGDENLFDIISVVHGEGSELLITFTSVGDENCTVVLFDNSGRQVMAEEVLTQEGLNQVKISTAGLSEGIYLLSLHNSRNFITQKILLK